ncbi:acetate--CoA ligase family protein [Microbacterium sp. NPDC055910]|uniref:acetate--CoA ligase family protein n=1 Tax=Microbacterium sp. NPDC055910 TaxID=3345659 RepID=UPI0035E37665
MNAAEGRRPALDLGSLLAPRSIAVIGASADEGRHNGRPIANLLRTGYDGAIYPVTRREGDVRGLASYRSIVDVPERVDLAYILVGADKVEEIIGECAAAGVRNVVVNASGFAEEGDAGEDAQRRIRDLAWSAGMRVIGPNCIGVLSVLDNAVSVTTLNITVQQSPGDVTIVSQSGGMATNLFNRAQGDGVGIRAMLSLGNEADVDVADVLDALADDAATSTVLLYVEQLRDVPRFRRAVARVRAAGKTILCVKAGRSQAGMRSAQSHTGAMAGEFAVFRDLVGAMGVIVVDTLDDLVDAARVRQHLGAVGGDRVLVVSPSGGECGYVADLAEGAGLTMPDLSEGLVAGLADIMRFGTPGNPLDLTGQVIGDDEMLGRVFGALERSAEFDLIVVALPTWGEFDSRRLMPPIVKAMRGSAVPVVLTAWSSRGLTEWREQMLRDEGVLFFDDAARAIRALVVAGTSGSADASAEAGEPGEAVQWDADAMRDEAKAKAWLAGLGIPVSDECVVPLDATVSPVGYPVVLKGVAPGVAHKSEYGLVATGIRDDRGLVLAADGIRAAAREHGVDLDGLLVARQYSGVEFIVGVTRDPSFGPVMLVGAGGVLAELLDDKTFIACPATEADVRTALGRLRVTRLLEGFRGRRGDVDALVGLLVRVSQIAARCPQLSELDLNPVIVGAPGEGAVVVDALVRGDDIDAAAARN